MTALELLATLRGAGAVVSLEGDQLRVTAPKGLLTSDWKAAITQHKAELLALLAAEASPIAVGDLVDAADPTLGRLVDEWPAVVDDVYAPAGGGGDWIGLRTKAGRWIAYVALEHVTRAAAGDPRPAQRELVGVM